MGSDASSPHVVRTPFNRRSSSPSQTSTPKPAVPPVRRSLLTFVKRPSMPSPSPKIIPRRSFHSNVATKISARVTELEATRPIHRGSLTNMTLKALGRSSRNLHELELKTANYDNVMRQFQLRKFSRDNMNELTDEEVGTSHTKGTNPLPRSSPSAHDIPEVSKLPSQHPQTTWMASPILPNSPVDHLHSTLRVVAFHTQVFLLPFQFAYGHHGVPSFVTVSVEMLLLGDLLMTCNTAVHDHRKHQKHHLVTSRRAILGHYARSWLLVDLLSSIPIQTIRNLLDGPATTSSIVRWFTQTFRIVISLLRLVHLNIHLQRLFQRHERSSDRSVWAWLWYSRYAHLLSIVKLLWLVVVVVHYLACIRHGMTIETTDTQSLWSEYFGDMFEAICLLQGQGDGTRTNSIAANLFSILTVLLGSVLLAIIFGNVAMLVANFNANSTNYQRKLESVVATMDKLHLPEPLRRRIHQYYSHLWGEYESLDGDVSGFSKELSHTLALEVGLCRHMNLIVDVPFWKDCSPDFVTQIVLNLVIRVYLPDDFVFRQGEVGNELFMINHGICDVYHGENTLNYRPESNKTLETTVLEPGTATNGCVRMETGAVLGEMSLLMNYRRTANVLAVTHVEMCILKRETFQQLIARYPEDRRVVLHRIVQRSIERNDKPFPWQELCAMMGVDPEPLTPAETATALLEHIEDKTIDPSIQYGFQPQTTSPKRHQPNPEPNTERLNEHIQIQMEELQRSQLELQRGQLALAQMMKELTTTVRDLDSKVTLVATTQSMQTPINPISPKGSPCNLLVRKATARAPVRLLPLRPRIHATGIRRSLNPTDLAREALPLSTLLWTQKTGEATTNSVSAGLSPLHRRQSLSPHLP